MYEWYRALITWVQDGYQEQHGQDRVPRPPSASRRTSYVPRPMPRASQVDPKTSRRPQTAREGRGEKQKAPAKVIAALDSNCSCSARSCPLGLGHRIPHCCFMFLSKEVCPCAAKAKAQLRGANQRAQYRAQHVGAGLPTPTSSSSHPI